MKTSFSVVIPIYNTAGRLQACLDSICAAADAVSDRVEIICVDDGSTDASGEIMQDAATRDNRIRCIRQTNAGVSVARNRGIALATGEWISFVDSDDCVPVDYFSLFASFEKKADINFFPLKCVKEDGENLVCAWSDAWRV